MSAPIARPRSWWPRQIPKIGTSPSSPWIVSIGVRHHLGVARAVRQEHAVGAHRQDVGGTRVGADDVDVAVVRQAERDVALHPEVDGHDAAAAVGIDGGDRVADRCGDGADEVDAVGAGLRLRRGEELVVRGRPERTGNRPVIADQAGQAAGVDAGDPGDALLVEHRAEVGLCPVIAVTPSQVAHDDAATERPDRLEIGGVDPVVADVRVRERDDLPGVARVGDHLLVSGEHGVEHDFTGRDRHVRADQVAFEDAAVGEHQLPLDSSLVRCSSVSVPLVLHVHAL